MTRLVEICSRHDGHGYNKKTPGATRGFSHDVDKFRNGNVNDDTRTASCD